LSSRFVMLQGGWPPSDSVPTQLGAPSILMAAPYGTMMVFAIPVACSGPVPYMMPVDPQGRPQPQPRLSDESVNPDHQICATQLSCKNKLAKLQNKKLAKQFEGDSKTCHRRGQLKLRNKKLEKDVFTASLTQRAVAVDGSNHIATTIAARRDEQLLRLALASFGDKSSRCETAIEELSTMAPSVDDASLLEESVSDEVPRIGIDIGGVLLESCRHNRSMREVPGGDKAVRDIIDTFGVSNVFLVSKVQLGGIMHTKTKEWLHGPNGFLERVGLPSKNVVFVSAISGGNGKGVQAKRLHLSHFVDNKWEVLEAVFSDRAGNSGDSVQRFHGRLFHFATGGIGKWKPELCEAARARVSPAFYSYYTAVSGWSEVQELLQGDASAKPSEEVQTCMSQGKLQHTSNPQGSTGQGLMVHSKKTPLATAFVSSPVSVHAVDVGIEEDTEFGVVKRLLGSNGEHFKWIASTTGVKLLLHGCGSPHPQPQSRQHEPLQVCIRASERENLKHGITLVEELINHVHQEHLDFRRLRGVA